MFPAKKKNRFSKILQFTRQNIFAFFRISFACKKCEYFRFFAKFWFNLFCEKKGILKNANFWANLSKKFENTKRIFLVKKLTIVNKIKVQERTWVKYQRSTASSRAGRRSRGTMVLSWERTELLRTIPLFWKSTNA